MRACVRACVYGGYGGNVALFLMERPERNFMQMEKERREGTLPIGK